MVDELASPHPGEMFVPAVRMVWTHGGEAGRGDGASPAAELEADGVAIAEDLPNRLTGRITKGEVDAVFTWTITASERPIRSGHTWTREEAELAVQAAIDQEAGRFYAARNPPRPTPGPLPGPIAEAARAPGAI